MQALVRVFGLVVPLFLNRFQDSASGNLAPLNKTQLNDCEILLLAWVG